MIDDIKKDLGESQKEIFLWHYRFRHVGFAHLNWLECHNKLPDKNSTSLDSCEKVVCAECEFCKYIKRQDGATKTKPRKYKNYKLIKDTCYQVKVYQYITISWLLLD